MSYQAPRRLLGLPRIVICQMGGRKKKVGETNVGILWRAADKKFNSHMLSGPAMLRDCTGPRPFVPDAPYKALVRRYIRGSP